MRGMQERGVPLDGFGLQQHVNIYTNLDDIKAAIEAYASLGITLHVTELDVSLYHPKDRPNPYYPKTLTIPHAKILYVRVRCTRIFLRSTVRIRRDRVCHNLGGSRDLTWLDMHPVPGRKITLFFSL